MTSDAENIEIYSFTYKHIEEPIKSVMDNSIKNSEEEKSVSVPDICKASICYQILNSTIYVTDKMSEVKVYLDVQFPHGVNQMQCFLLLEEFETGRYAAFATTRQGHADDLIDFQIDQKTRGIVITVQVRTCNIKAAEANYKKIAAKLSEFNLDKTNLPLEPKAPRSWFVRFRCLLFYRDNYQEWRHTEAKSEAIMFKPPPPKLKSVQPKEIRFTGARHHAVVKLDRDLVNGYDSVSSARLELTQLGETGRDVDAEVQHLDGCDVSLSIGECVLSPDESTRVLAKIRLFGQSGGVDWCVESDVSLLPASLPPTKLERQNQATMNVIEEVDWSSFVLENFKKILE